jgi:hypothetical protein
VLASELPIGVLAWAADPVPRAMPSTAKIAPYLSLPADTRGFITAQ